MRSLRTLLFVLVLGLVAFGCGNDSSAPTAYDPSAAEQDVDAGNDALASGDYAAANVHYRSALDKDPNNAEANLGAAITGIFLLENDPDINDAVTGLGGVVPFRAPITTSARPADRSGPGLLGIQNPAYEPAAMGRMTFRLFAEAADNPTMVSDVQELIKTKVMPALTYAEARLNMIETQPGFVLKVPPAITGEADSLEIDLGEIYMLDAVINGIQGWMGLIVAYNFDVPDFEAVNPESLLAPGTAFGTLHADGALRLNNAHADFLLVNTRVDAAAAYIAAETDDQDDDVIPQAALSDPGFLEFMDGLDQMYTSLTGPVNVDVDDASGAPFTFAIQIGRFFTAPIADLKTELPDHDFGVDGDPYLVDPITFPDPTINGIFPDMTNERWRTLVGPVGPSAVAQR